MERAMIATLEQSNAPSETADDSLESSTEFRAELAHLCKMLSDPNRLRIVFFLLNKTELNVTEFCNRLGQSQPAVSHHLALLRVAGFVDKRREGKHNFYRVCHEKIKDVLTALFQTVPGRNAFIEFEAFRIEYHPHKATLTQNVSEGQQSKSQSVSS